MIFPLSQFYIRLPVGLEENMVTLSFQEWKGCREEVVMKYTVF